MARGISRALRTMGRGARSARLPCRWPVSRRLGSGSSALPPLPEGHAKRRFGFFRRAISTSFLPMSCPRYPGA